MIARPTTSSAQLASTLLWSAVVTGILAVAGAGIGYLAGGWSGLWSAMVGVVMAGLFLGMTAGVILIAAHLPGEKFQSPAYFGVVLGGWALKIIVFGVVLLLLRGQPWVDPYIFFFAVVIGTIAALIVDVVMMMRTRVPYVGDVALPTAADDEPEPERRR